MTPNEETHTKNLVAENKRKQAIIDRTVEYIEMVQLKYAGK